MGLRGEKKLLVNTMAHNSLRCSTCSFGRKRTNTDDSRKEVFEAAKSGDFVLLNDVLKNLDNTERISVLGADFQYIGDGSSWQVSEKSADWVTPLIVSVQNGNLDCVEVLLKYGADIEERGDFMHDYKCCTPLLFAATCGNVEMLRFLVENGANVNGTDDFGVTPLMAAVANQLLDAVTFLIDQGADVNLQDSSGLTALHYASEFSFDPSVVEQLINRGANINAVAKYDMSTPLIIACSNKNVSVVNFLLQNGANVALADDNLWTALHFVVHGFNDSSEILKSLLNYRADVNARSVCNETPLMVASQSSDVETVTLLIEQDACVHCQDEKGNTALHNAARRKSEEIVGTLLNAGASNLCNSQGMTPLLLACSRGCVAMVENLIKQPEITKEQRINALELLGASVLIEECMLENADLHDLKGFKYIKDGLMERRTGLSGALFKQEMEPVEAYQNRRECQTLDELAEIEGDRDAIIMESLIIQERIMGRNYEDLIAVIRNVAHYYEEHDLSSCIKLLRHAMKTAWKCNLSAVLDLSIITSALFNRFENGDLSKEEDFLDVLDETILDHDYEIQRKMTNKQDLRYDMLYLFDSLQKLVFMISKFECADEGRLSSSALLLKTISNLNLRDGDSNTLLHQFAIHHGRHSSYSCSEAVKLLLNAGFNVNAINGNGDTALHIVATLKPSDDKIHLLTDMLQVLFDGGAHHDFVNNDGKTPMDMAGTDEARMILSERRKLELKCISARAVKRFGIPYLELVPKILEKDISMH